MSRTERRSRIRLRAGELKHCQAETLHQARQLPSKIVTSLRQGGKTAKLEVRKGRFYAGKNVYFYDLK